MHNTTITKINSEAHSANKVILNNDIKIELQKNFLNKYHKLFKGVVKYNKDQVHLFINDKIRLVAQKAKRIPYK